LEERKRELKKKKRKGLQYSTEPVYNEQDERAEKKKETAHNLTTKRKVQVRQVLSTVGKKGKPTSECRSPRKKPFQPK